MGLEYYKAYVIYTKITRWAQLKDNPICVKETLNKYYWDACDIIEELEYLARSQLRFIILTSCVLHPTDA